MSLKVPVHLLESRVEICNQAEMRLSSQEINQRCPLRKSENHHGLNQALDGDLLLIDQRLMLVDIVAKLYVSLLGLVGSNTNQNG